MKKTKFQDGNWNFCSAMMHQYLEFRALATVKLAVLILAFPNHMISAFYYELMAGILNYFWYTFLSSFPAFVFLFIKDKNKFNNILN